MLLRVYARLAVDRPSVNDDAELNYTSLMDGLQLAIADFEQLCLPAIR